MPAYITDHAMIALCDAIADSDDSCRALDLLPDCLTGFVENYQIEFELGARLDIWRHSARPIIEAGMTEAEIADLGCMRPNQ